MDVSCHPPRYVDMHAFGFENPQLENQTSNSDSTGNHSSLPVPPLPPRLITESEDMSEAVEVTALASKDVNGHQNMDLTKVPQLEVSTVASVDTEIIKDGHSSEYKVPDETTKHSGLASEETSERVEEESTIASEDTSEEATEESTLAAEDEMTESTSEWDDETEDSTLPAEFKASGNTVDETKLDGDISPTVEEFVSIGPLFNESEAESEELQDSLDVVDFIGSTGKTMKEKVV